MDSIYHYRLPCHKNAISNIAILHHVRGRRWPPLLWVTGWFPFEHHMGNGCKAIINVLIYELLMCNGGSRRPLHCKADVVVVGQGFVVVSVALVLRAIFIIDRPSLTLELVVRY